MSQGDEWASRYLAGWLSFVSTTVHIVRNIRITEKRTTILSVWPVKHCDKHERSTGQQVRTLAKG